MLPARISLIGLAVVTLFVSPAKSAEGDAIKRSVESGVKALKDLQNRDGTFPYNAEGSTTGASALAGIALLECETPTNDPTIKSLATYIRRASLTLTDTYSLALCILFLDLISDDRDIPLIESMVVRLMEGQDSTGGWTYTCPGVSADERDRLSASLKANRDEPANADKMPVAKDRKREPREISPEIKKRIAQLKNRPGVVQNLEMSDNSNTQFALLALWVGSRYSLPVESALARVDERFRKMQNSDGGWGYKSHSSGRGNLSGSTYSMTCAGLLGLAVGHGARVSLRTDASKKTKSPDQKDTSRNDAARDKAVNSGLKFLAGEIGRPVGLDTDRGRFGPGPRLADTSYYLLWSIERVAVAYGLETIGNKDWYAWASDALVSAQKRNGIWDGSYGATVDSSFALLVLRKANLAADLTVALKGKVKDPSHITLKSTTTENAKSKPANEDPPPAKAKQDEAPPVAAKPANALARPKETESIDTPDAAATGLSRDLVEGSDDKKQKALDGFRSGRGSAYTRELASAIGRLEGEDKKKARDVLAERLSEMTPGTVGEKLKDDNAEIRRAAALACAMNEEKVHVPRLIEMLEDADQSVRRAAYASLKSLTGQDFGPSKNASAEEILVAQKAWQTWWKKQNDK
jgi:hypothetical protein